MRLGLGVTAHLLRFLHVVAAVIWVGGQLAVSLIRAQAVAQEDDASWHATHALVTAAWVAYAVLWGTGIVNFIGSGDASHDERYGVLMLAKLGAVAASAVAAKVFLDAGTVGATRAGAWVNTTLALVALYLGVSLAH